MAEPAYVEYVHASGSAYEGIQIDYTGNWNAFEFDCGLNIPNPFSNELWYGAKVYVGNSLNSNENTECGYAGALSLQKSDDVSVDFEQIGQDSHSVANSARHADSKTRLACVYLLS